MEILIPTKVMNFLVQFFGLSKSTQKIDQKIHNSRWNQYFHMIYSHNFSFRRDIICPVSFAIFLCFSLPLHDIAVPHICRPSMVGGNTFVAASRREILVCIFRSDRHTLISLTLLAANKEIHSLSFPPSMADKCVASQCRAMVERSKEKQQKTPDK